MNKAHDFRPVLRCMRSDRTIAELESCDEALVMLAKLHYVRASDGVYVPRSDLSQYERRERPERIVRS